jgi:hypothetical protein
MLRLLVSEGGFADPMLRAKIHRLHPYLVLIQFPDDLLLRMPALLSITRELQFSLVESYGNRSAEVECSF